MIRVLIFVVIITIILYFIIKKSNTGIAICDRCDGQGYWKGLRGERNNCKQCGGTGEIDLKVD